MELIEINIIGAQRPQRIFNGGGDARSMAGGVSKATLPTMAGMVVALSGVFATIYLSSASDRHTNDLRELIKREL